MSKRITELTAAVAGDLAATTTAFEVATNVTTVPLSRKITLGVLRDFLASAVTGFAAVAVTVSLLGVGTAPLAQNAATVGGTVVAASGAAHGIRVVTTLTAAVNGDTLRGGFISPSLTPGAFTAVATRGLGLGGFSLATFTSPADAAVLSIGTLTGTGATNVAGILISPPTGATNNYLIADSGFNTFTVLATGQVGIGGASSISRGIRVIGSISAAAGIAIQAQFGGTLVASVNNDSLLGIRINPTFTPGAFTGLGVIGFDMSGFSVAPFTTPGSPVGINIGIITGTGATNAIALQLSPPTGAMTNYLIAHTTPATFYVKADGSINGSAFLVAGVAGTDFTGAVAAKSFTVVKGIVTAVV